MERLMVSTAASFSIKSRYSRLNFDSAFLKVPMSAMTLSIMSAGGRMPLSS